MSSTVGHALCGIACLTVARGTRSGAVVLTEKWWAIIFIALACLPDLDFIAGYIVAGDFHRYHSGASHSLVAVLLASTAIGIFLPRMKRRALLPWIFITVLSHVVVDLFTGPRIGFQQSYGVCLFWPFYDARIRMPISLFYGVEHATFEALVGWHNIKVIGIEILTFTPLIVLLRKLFRKRTAVAVKERL